jgi:cysteinyl-tRNA synthetase
MGLKVYNTASRQKEEFAPIDPRHIKMYVCGPTVYNLIHIGNARPVVVFDVLFRLLQNEYPKVTYARNITDIDDKIINAAAENGEPIGELSARYAKEYEKDTDALGTLQPTLVPYATQHIPQMISMIERLIESGNAYEAEGHVLFAVKALKAYGKLSNRSLEDMLEGARVEVAPYKKYAGDFVLWKPSTGNAPGWESPWGYGRPGWHLECSAMIEAHLGDTIDIHGGGRDLIFPHHENELAQSCCAHDGKEYVRYWMHNGYVNINGEKMSKSLGNFRTVRELLEKYRGEVIRYALLSAQYRSELDFSKELLDQSKASLDTLYGFLRENISTAAIDVDLDDQPVYKALLDDLNTPVAISELYALAKSLGSAESNEKTQLKSVMLKAGSLMGLLQQDPDAWFQSGEADQISSDEIEQLIAERVQAKLDKNYVRADEIRSHLESEGVLLEDSREGTKWKRA